MLFARRQNILPTPPLPSPLSVLISNTTAQLAPSAPIPTSALALPLEILHNLQYQHSWRDLQLYFVDLSGRLIDMALPPLAGTLPQLGCTARGPSMSNTCDLNLLQPGNISNAADPTSPASALTADPIVLISGVPPRPVYIHPDLQTLLLKSGLKAEEVLGDQREWVLPLSLGMDDFKLKILGRVFDGLPVRDPIKSGVAGKTVARRRDLIQDEEKASGLGILNPVTSTKLNELNAPSIAAVPPQTSTSSSSSRDSEDPNDIHEDIATTPTEEGRQLSTPFSSSSSASSNPLLSTTEQTETESTSGLTPTRLQTLDVNSIESSAHTDDTVTVSASNPQPVAQPHESSQAGQALQWQDTKRLLLALKSHDGKGGDGTIAYYVCLEGEVKPRQNG